MARRENDSSGCCTSGLVCLIIGWLDVIFSAVIIGGASVALDLCRNQMECRNSGYVSEDDMGNSSPNQYDCQINNIFFGAIQWAGGVILIVGIVNLLPPVFLIHGTRKERPGFLIPFIMWNILLACGIIAVLCKMDNSFDPVAVKITLGILLTMKSCKVAVALEHFKYLHKKTRAENINLRLEA